MNISNNIQSNQIISIVGATATGKTALALELANELVTKKLYRNVHLLSADSRQVYKGLEILTGADIPKNFREVKSQKFAYRYFINQKENIFIHGVSIILTNEDWSTAHFAKLLLEVKSQMAKGELLIVVGGTGFYHKQVDNPSDTLFIPPDQNLRNQLEELSLDALQKKLQLANKEKFKQLNNSDLNNPRRLIRAIELATFNNISKVKKSEHSYQRTFYLQIDKKVREEKIKKRVEDRFDKAKREVEPLLSQTKISKLASTSTGFNELTLFINGQLNRENCIKLWQLAEIKYAKRQDTWWKKQNNLIEIKDRTNLQIMLNYLQEEI